MLEPEQLDAEGRIHLRHRAREHDRAARSVLLHDRETVCGRKGRNLAQIRIARPVQCGELLAGQGHGPLEPAEPLETLAPVRRGARPQDERHFEPLIRGGRSQRTCLRQRVPLAAGQGHSVHEASFGDPTGSSRGP